VLFNEFTFGCIKILARESRVKATMRVHGRMRKTADECSSNSPAKTKLFLKSMRGAKSVTLVQLP